MEPVEEGEEVAVDSSQPKRKMKIRNNLSNEDKEELISVLRDNQDIFAWAHSDMTDIDPHIICHALNVDLSYPSYQQKRRVFDQARKEALEAEVDKLLANGFIREAQYPTWLSNPVLVSKPNGTWRTFIDFSDLNKACPKDCFPLPNIDQMVDATARYELLSFMDA